MKTVSNKKPVNSAFFVIIVSKNILISLCHAKIKLSLRIFSKEEVDFETKQQRMCFKKEIAYCNMKTHLCYCFLSKATFSCLYRKISTIFLC